jgi:hypothetical protein
MVKGIVTSKKSSNAKINLGFLGSDNRKILSRESKMFFLRLILREKGPLFLLKPGFLYPVKHEKI